jgi:hypothetical protein
MAESTPQKLSLYTVQLKGLYENPNGKSYTKLKSFDVMATSMDEAQAAAMVQYTDEYCYGVEVESSYGHDFKTFTLVLLSPIHYDDEIVSYYTATHTVKSYTLDDAKNLAFIKHYEQYALQYPPTHMILDTDTKFTVETVNVETSTVA